MKIAVVERVVGLRARRNTAGLAVAGQGKYIEIDPALRCRIGTAPVMVAQNRPKGRLPQQFRIDLEKGALVLRVRPVRIGVVAQH